MFEKILIANRGEIALRIHRACREMGIHTVAIHSTADANAMHVRLADESVCIGAPPPNQSYLNIPAIISAATITGADAIHPGVGFLSENAGFAEIVEAHGFTFIGPSAAHIRMMGDKITAKETAKKLGIPVVPGSEGGVADLEQAKEVAGGMGYPVIIKATAGGGGRGMKVAKSEAELEVAFRTARSEAKAAFGNDEVYIEKYLQKPRHIEVQVFGDGKGKAVHLGERDCSLQRRHQKVFEEAPGPSISPEERAHIGGICARAVAEMGYSGAGTIEFLYEDGEFYFIEMNTRLQVEHPVTEAITGVDLVEWQLRVAAGEALPCQQEDLAITGHAFEARLYAEDVPAGFLPAIGRLDHLAFPGEARIDAGVRPGDAISPWYDPMIAKIITHGPTRSVALARLRAALAGTEVAGSVTNLAFLGALAAHEGFNAGDVDTGLIGRDLEALVAGPELEPATLALAALAAHGLDGAPGPLTGFALWLPLWQTVVLQRGEDDHEIRIARLADGAFALRTDTAEMRAEWRGGRWWIDGQAAGGRAVRRGGRLTVFGAQTLEFTLADPLAVEAAAGAAAGVVIAPMPGLVKAVFVEAGATVEKGARLAVLEAMKMEHTLSAGRDGVVAEILAEAGSQVEAGAPLIRLEEE